MTKLAGVTFHQKLGTMEKKQQRVRKLAGFIASSVRPHDDKLKQACERAADLCKADLLTGVSESFRNCRASWEVNTRNMTVNLRR